MNQTRYLPQGGIWLQRLDGTYSSFATVDCEEEQMKSITPFPEISWHPSRYPTHISFRIDAGMENLTCSLPNSTFTLCPAEIHTSFPHCCLWLLVQHCLLQSVTSDAGEVSTFPQHSFLVFVNRLPPILPGRNASAIYIYMFTLCVAGTRISFFSRSY